MALLEHDVAFRRIIIREDEEMLCTYVLVY